MSKPTFRDFAGAIMQGDEAAAGGVLSTLLGLDESAAGEAAAHFSGKMQSEGQAFMMKAMGLRTVLESGNESEIGSLLTECFGLQEAAISSSIQSLKAEYAG